MDPGDAALFSRLKWLVGLRWLAAAGVVVLSALCVQVLGFPIPLVPLQLLGGAIALYNVGFRWWLLSIRKREPGDHRRALTVCANTQISADLLALALVIHLTGGIESPLAFFFVFHMIIASMILSREAAYAQAVLVLALYGAVVLLEAADIIPHYHLGIGADPDMYRSLDAWPMFAVVVATVAVVVYLTSTVAGELHERERQLATLTEELAQQAGACQIAYDELEDTQRAQLEYMRRIAHELKSPLSAIAMTLDAVLDSLPEPLPGRQQEMLQRARMRANTALDLTEDLLTLSELKEAAVGEEEAEVSVSHLVENTVSEEELSAEQQGVRFAVEIEEGLPLVRGYRTQLSGMLRNLVTNAVKFSPDGGQVTVRAHSEGESVVIEVQDEGIGIAPEEVERIFDEFYRTAAARKSGITGTGLGLPIVKSVVERHGGDIAVDSAPGRGSTFRVRLPTSSPPGNGNEHPPTGPH